MTLSCPIFLGISGGAILTEIPGKIYQDCAKLSRRWKLLGYQVIWACDISLPWSVDQVDLISQTPVVSLSELRDAAMIQTCIKLTFINSRPLLSSHNNFP